MLLMSHFCVSSIRNAALLMTYMYLEFQGCLYDSSAADDTLEPSAGVS